MLFNTVTKTCAISALVNCGDRVKPDHKTTTSPAPTTETPDEGFKCKNSFYGVYVDPERCDRYYTCSMKKATLHKCPGNWLFNSLTRTCAIPALVSCGGRVIPTVPTSTTEIPTTTETTTIPTTVPTSTSPTTTETTTIPTTVPTSTRISPTTIETTTIPTTVPTSPRTSPTTKIPTTVADCATDGYFPVVGDCSRFFICHNGMRYDQRCVDGLVYNPIMEICDWPANVPSCK